MCLVWHLADAWTVLTCSADLPPTLHASGALYAECPIPSDKPIITVVEPVIDSSRYFVLRIEDRASRRHAFIGLGFRERAHASDFNAALHEHQQYVRRKRLAEAQRAAFEERERLAGEDGSDAGVAASPAALAPAVDRSLKPGERLTLRIAAGASRGGFVSSRQGSLGKKQVSLVMDGEAVLAPPPPAGRRRSTDLPMCVSPSTSSASEASDSADSAEEGGEAVCSRLRALQLGDSPRTGGDAGATTKQWQQARSQAQQPQQAGGGPQPAAGDQGGAGVPPAEDDSEFGEFVG